MASFMRLIGFLITAFAVIIAAEEEIIEDDLDLSETRAYYSSKDYESSYIPQSYDRKYFQPMIVKDYSPASYQKHDTSSYRRPSSGYSHYQSFVSHPQPSAHKVDYSYPTNYERGYAKPSYAKPSYAKPHYAKPSFKPNYEDHSYVPYGKVRNY